MLTPFGKELRIFRLNNGELLKDMAIKLDISPAYLSAIENGKKEPTKELMARIRAAYHMSTKDAEALEEARARTLKEVVICFHGEDDADLSLKFARKLSSLSKDQRKQILNLLNQDDE